MAQPGYRELEEPGHRSSFVGKMAPHVVMRRIHRVIAQLKRWAPGVYHRLPTNRLRAYLGWVRCPRSARLSNGAGTIGPYDPVKHRLRTTWRAAHRLTAHLSSRSGWPRRRAPSSADLMRPGAAEAPNYEAHE